MVVWIRLSIDGIFCELEYMTRSSTYRWALTFAGRFDSMPLIASRNREQLRTLPCGTPCSCWKSSDCEAPIWVLKVLSLRKFRINSARFPLIPASWMVFSMWYLHAVSYAFSMSKKTAIICSLRLNESRMSVWSYMRASIVDLCFLKPNCMLDIAPLSSRVLTSLTFTTFSTSLHTELVSAIGL